MTTSLVKRFVLTPHLPAMLKTLGGTRDIHWSKLSNKRITRLESDIEIEDSKEYKSRLINRNPTNLEQMCFEQKPAGYFLEKSPQLTWNFLSLDNDGKFLTAKLKNWSGKTLVEASTQEETLRKYTPSPTSTQAAIVLAQVIAIRCLRSGYLYAGAKTEELSSKETVFYEHLKQNGLKLEEPPEITPRSISDL